MVHESLSWVRDRIDRSDIVGAGVFTGVLVALDADVNVIAMVISMAVVVPVLEGALDRFDVDPGLAWLCFGAFAVVAGVVQLREGALRFGGVLLAVGAWICLDGLYTWRTEDSTATDEDEDDMTKEEVYLVTQHNRWLLEALREADRPLTRDEICDRTGLMESDFERVLEFHDESGPIERVGNGYAFDEDRTGAVPFVRKVLRSACKRIVRPFRLFRPNG